MENLCKNQGKLPNSKDKKSPYLVMYKNGFYEAVNNHYTRKYVSHVVKICPQYAQIRSDSG